MESKPAAEAIKSLLFIIEILWVARKLCSLVLSVEAFSTADPVTFGDKRRVGVFDADWL